MTIIECPNCHCKFQVVRKQSEKRGQASQQNGKLGGRKPKVTAAKLQDIFEKRENWTAENFRRQIEQQTGHSMDRSHVSRLLRNLKRPATTKLERYMKSKEFLKLIAETMARPKDSRLPTTEFSRGFQDDLRLL